MPLSPLRAALDNGVIVLAKASQATPAVTIHLRVHAGAVFDPLVQPGLAHFVSRVIDRGTETRPSDAIAEALDRRAVSLAIGVNRHLMSLTCTCLAEDLEETLGLVADIIMRPSFPEDEVNTRRAEIVTLIRQDADNPAAVASERLAAELYGPVHPYGRPLKGTVEAVDGIDRASLIAFHERRFRPSAVTVALVGDVVPEYAVDAAAAAFGAWALPAAPTTEIAAPEASRGRRVRVVPMMNKAQADIAYGFTSIPRSSPEYDAYWLMNTILGQYSLGGRLGDSIRERQGMAYYVFSALDANVVAGPLTIRAGVSPAHVERTVQSIDEELSRFAADGPTATELTEARQYLVGSAPRMLETNAGIAGFLQTVEFFGLGLDYDVRLPALLGTVTREDVHAAARASLVPARATVVVAGPYDGALS